MIILLDNVRSIFNVGAIFRTADSVGANNLILSGYTPHPPEPKLIKTSLGAIESVSWEHLTDQDTLNYLKKLKEQDTKIISVEQSNNSIWYTEALHRNLITWDNTVYVFGNEIVGVSKEILDISDYTLEIPMYGKKNSLNISVSVGIIVYEARKFKSN